MPSPAQDLPSTQRERAKHDRRRRIVDAAHDLLRDGSLDDLSGKAIAARAGVSLSTLYNLFGSKDAVLVAVYDDDLARFERLVRARADDGGLACLFGAVEVAMMLYAADPAFYRAMMWRRAPDGVLDAAVRQPRARFWEGLVVRAQAEGALRGQIDAAALARLLVYVYGGALSDWIADELTLEALAREVTFGFATALLPYATRAAQADLRSRLAAL
jgi:AcrR family transcriptional regulator